MNATRRYTIRGASNATPVATAISIIVVKSCSTSENATRVWEPTTAADVIIMTLNAKGRTTKKATRTPSMKRPIAVSERVFTAFFSLGYNAGSMYAYISCAITGLAPRRPSRRADFMRRLKPANGLYCAM